MGNATLNKETQSVTIGKTTLRSVVDWDHKIPVHEAIGLLREFRKEHPKANFPSHVLMDDALVSRWQSHSEDVRNFFRANIATPCQEWIVYGSSGQEIKAGTIQFSKDGWTAVAEGVPKEVVEKYNAVIRSGRNAALFVKRYNDGLPILEKDKSRVVITPSEEGIIVVNNFLRENGQSGKMHNITRLPLAAKATSDGTTRWSYTVDNKLSYVGPLVRGYLDGVYYGRRDVDAYRELPDCLGVLAAGMENSPAGAVAAKLTLAGLTQKVEALEIELKRAKGKLQLARDMATDARPKLEDLKKVVKSENLKEFIELIKLHTEQ